MSRKWYNETLQREITIPDPVALEFVPDVKAPIYNEVDDKELIMQHLTNELSSPNFHLNEEIIELIRQTSYVSLWFFLKYIAGYSGPYADLTDHLHVDMCNYRQKMLTPGIKGAAFIPRSMYKTTIFSHGANAWELLRDPNLRIGMVGSVTTMAEQNMHQTQRTFDSNKLIEEIFPEYVPAKGLKGNIMQRRWNDVEMVMPNRTIDMPEPSIKCIGAMASAQGNHFDLMCADDLVGEKQLSSDHSSSEEMYKIGNWFLSNQDTLLVSPLTSRVFLSATRYSLDDAYEVIMENIKEQYGYWDEIMYDINEHGYWHVYYRMAIERDELIFPEKVDKEFLTRLKKVNPWSYFTQYLNNPHDAQAAEFSEYQVRKCWLDYSRTRGYSICFSKGRAPVELPLSQCEVIIGVDPAASEKRMSIRTSRSAVVVIARDRDDNRYYIDGSVGYYEPTKLLDEIFRLYKKYKQYVRMTAVEAAGAFKMFYSLLGIEQRRRGEYIGLRPIQALPDKDAKIRNFIQPLLDRGQVYVTGTIGEYIEEEIMTFPGGMKKDLLDAMEIGNRFSVKQFNEGELDEVEDDRELMYEKSNGNRNRNSVTGY